MEALIAVLIVCLSAAGLAAGLLLGRKPLARSCGGCTGARCPGCRDAREDT